MERFDRFTSAYLECAFWSGIAYGSPAEDAARAEGFGGGFSDSFDECGYTLAEMSPELIARVIAECAAFQADHAADLADLDPAQCGHDFWLTRNGHGAGFWDRGYAEALGERLSEAARKCGGQDWYIGDDGKIYG